MVAFARPGQDDRRNQAQLETGSEQAMRQGAVIVASCFKADNNRSTDGCQIVREAVVISLGGMTVMR